jgi:hypothetical protein
MLSDNNNFSSNFVTQTNWIIKIKKKLTVTLGNKREQKQDFTAFHFFSIFIVAYFC